MVLAKIGKEYMNHHSRRVEATQERSCEMASHPSWLSLSNYYAILLFDTSFFVCILEILLNPAKCFFSRNRYSYCVCTLSLIFFVSVVLFTESDKMFRNAIALYYLWTQIIDEKLKIQYR